MHVSAERLERVRRAVYRQTDPIEITTLVNWLGVTRASIELALDTLVEQGSVVQTMLDGHTKLYSRSSRGDAEG